MECKHTSKEGSNCQAQAVSNDEYCFAHSQLPTIIEKRSAAKSLGGRNGRKMMLRPATNVVSVKSAKQVINLLEQTINDVRMNRIAVNQANCIGYLCNVASKIMEQELLETRVTVLERTMLIERREVNDSN